MLVFADHERLHTLVTVAENNIKQKPVNLHFLIHSDS
jgi:hypothetical protein